MPDALEIALVVVLAACLVAAAVLAVAEVSLIRVRRSSVLLSADAGSARARHLLSLLDELPVVLNTVLLLVLLSQVGAATIAAFLADRLVGGVGVTVASFVLTIALFIYGEAIPKTAAVREPDRWAMRVTPLLHPIVWVFRPVVATLVRVVDLQTKGDVEMVGALSEAELRALARESAEVGMIGDSDITLLERSFEFGDRTVGDVMVERSAIVFVSDARTPGEALDIAIAAGHRRLPVASPGLDDVIGVARMRDLAAAEDAASPVSLASVTRDVLRCAPDYPIARLLNDMQAASIWTTLVEDADGRTVGLATMEDLVAELVGEIADDDATHPNPSAGESG